MDTFDYVIVGAGTAGCILANRLSADAGVTVCVLEAGPRDWHPYIHIPAGFIKLFSMPKLNWLYTQEPSEWTGGRRILAPRGKTLGGSSSINGHIYNRGQRGDYDGWAQRGNRNWGYADVLPYFKRLERRIGEGDEIVPRARRRDHHHRHRLLSSAERGVHRRRGRDGYPAQPRLQRRKPARHQLRAACDPQGPPRQRGARLPASRDEAAQPRRAHQGARDGADFRGQARRRHPLSQGRAQRAGNGSTRAPRGDPLGRHVQFAAVAAALRRGRARIPQVEGNRRALTRCAASARTCAITTRRVSRCA